MKLSIRGLLICTLGAAALSLSPLALSPAQAEVEYGIITLGQERVQVIHAGDDSDQTNMNFVFTNDGGRYGSCNEVLEQGGLSGAATPGLGGYGDYDAIATGVEVALLGESCESYRYDCYHYGYCPPTSSFPFDYVINPFVAHTVNHQTYGTFFGLNPVYVGPGTVSARILALSTPAYTCGTWDLNLEATGLDLYSIKYNPISLWLNDAADSGPFCFDIDNAVIGPPVITEPPTVRRGVRH